jgi:serine/threonine protein kinase
VSGLDDLAEYMTNSERKHIDPSILLENLTKIADIGRSQISVVTLVRHETTRRTYALKQINRKRVDTQARGKALSRERLLLSTLSNRFVGVLRNTYKDQDSVYYLMDPCLGGLLSNYMNGQPDGILSRQCTRFCAASITLLFRYLHYKNIIFRNLRPEKILLDQYGYLKVADFKPAKFLKRKQRTHTLTGTPEYLAPEMVLGTGYERGVDWWMLGILVYEMRAGFSPFADNDLMAVYDKIVKGKLTYPKHFKTNTKSFISELLAANPIHRLGALSVGDIMDHAFFASKTPVQDEHSLPPTRTLDWKLLEKRQLTSPLDVKVRTKYDVHNFGDQNLNSSAQSSRRRASIADLVVKPTKTFTRVNWDKGF